MNDNICDHNDDKDYCRRLIYVDDKTDEDKEKDVDDAGSISSGLRDNNQNDDYDYHHEEYSYQSQQRTSSKLVHIFTVGTKLAQP